jgi:4-amino-4-deoxy-L-arabinose transferase-like glycosyltransferase
MSSAATPPHGFRTDIIIFLVSFAIHAGVVLLHVQHTHDVLNNDEPRYVAYGWNIILGSYVPDNNPDFVNGPGYPAVLVPFLKWGIPMYWARLLNSLMIALSAVLLFWIVQWKAGRWWGVIAAAWITLHMDVLLNGREVVTEAMTLLLVTSVAGMFCVGQARGVKGWMACVLCAVLLACLTMTRVMFGHVTMVAFLGSIVLLPFWKHGRAALARLAFISAIAFALCLPYLAYTKAKTGKNLCWSTNSGELLYWMTRTHPGHNGTWLSFEVAMTHPEIAPIYGAFFSKVTNLPVLERERIFTEEAIKSIKTEPPMRLAYNWVCNVCRLLVAYPTALKKEGLTSVAVSIFNAPFLVLVAAAGLFALWKPRTMPPDMLILFALALIYTGGSTVATARSRYFVVITPMLWIASTAIISRCMRLQWVEDLGDKA